MINLKNLNKFIPCCIVCNCFYNKNCQWSGNLHELLCLCFDLYQLQDIFTKLFKVPIALLGQVSFRIIMCLDNVLLMWRTLQETLMAMETIITFEFWPQKISPWSCESNRVSAINNRYKENYVGSFSEKIKACVSTMSGDFHATKDLNLKSHKINQHAVMNCPSYFTSTNPVSISSTETNISSSEKRVLQSYSGHVTLWN